MGQVLHGSATTTEAVRRAIQHSQASLRTLAKMLKIGRRAARGSAKIFNRNSRIAGGVQVTKKGPACADPF
jgi:hypothetical protein